MVYKMTKIKIWYQDDNGESCSYEFNHLKPRIYMCGYTFNQLMKYIKNELYWTDIKPEQVTEIIIFNERYQWQQIIKRDGE